MNSCKHDVLTLVPVPQDRLRCKHCHLTITKEELGSGDCPECLEVHEIKRRDFEAVNTADKQTARYCCERCGTLIECPE